MDTAIIPKSSSCDSRDFEVKPKAACQSVQLDTCNDSDISVVGISGTSVKHYYMII
jgi:predicted ribonuclease YlaK